MVDRYCLFVSVYLLGDLSTIRHIPRVSSHFASVLLLLRNSIILIDIDWSSALEVGGSRSILLVNSMLTFWETSLQALICYRAGPFLPSEKLITLICFDWFLALEGRSILFGQSTYPFQESCPIFAIFQQFPATLQTRLYRSILIGRLTLFTCWCLSVFHFTRYTISA